jgi:hypothetical protein
MSGPLDTEIRITVFDNLQARFRDSQISSLRAFAEGPMLHDRAPDKDGLRLACFAGFGERRAPRSGSLRSDANLNELHCITVDCDDETTSLAEAAAAIEQANIAGVLSTTFRYSSATPRWRFTAVLRTPLNRNTLDRFPALVSRLAGIFPTARLDPASWTLSQSWYIGGRDGNAEHGVRLFDGDYLDERDDLDANARPKPTGNGKLHEADEADDGEVPEAPADLAELLERISAGRGSHDALVSAAGKLASQAVPKSSALAILRHAADTRPDAERDDGWRAMRDDIRRVLDWAYGREADKEAELSQALTLPAVVPAGFQEAQSIEIQQAGTGGTGAPPPPPPGSGPSGAPGTPPPQPQAGPAALPGLLRHRAPRFECNVENVATALTTHAQLIGCVGYDEFALRTMLTAPLPGMTGFTLSRPLTDTDAICLQRFLQRHLGMNRVSQTTCLAGMEAIGRQHSYHPVWDYLESLQWDGTPRLDTWLHVYAGAEGTEYRRHAGRMWLLSGVARIYVPGCQADYMLVLEGDQGELKSSLFRALASDAWFSDQSLNLKHDMRAVSQHLAGKWIIEIAELESLKGATLGLVRSFLTRRTETYLRRFARAESDEPRQCIFGGTTNEPVYLYDETGNRRDWPVKIGTVDLAKLRADRDQLWAEAVHAFKAGEDWWPDRGLEKRLFREEQDNRFDHDSWSQFIVPHLEALVKAAEYEQANWDRCTELGITPATTDRPVARTTTGDVYRKALASPTALASGEPTRESFDRTAQLKVRAILIKAGWQITRKSHGSWWWEYRQ